MRLIKCAAALLAISLGSGLPAAASACAPGIDYDVAKSASVRDLVLLRAIASLDLDPRRPADRDNVVIDILDFTGAYNSRLFVQYGINFRGMRKAMLSNGETGSKVFAVEAVGSVISTQNLKGILFAHILSGDPNRVETAASLLYLSGYLNQAPARELNTALLDAAICYLEEPRGVEVLPDGYDVKPEHLYRVRAVAPTFRTPDSGPLFARAQILKSGNRIFDVDYQKAAVLLHYHYMTADYGPWMAELETMKEGLE